MVMKHECMWYVDLRNACIQEVEETQGDGANVPPRLSWVSGNDISSFDLLDCFNGDFQGEGGPAHDQVIILAFFVCFLPLYMCTAPT
jgi:hypothetical protein